MSPNTEEESKYSSIDDISMYSTVQSAAVGMKLVRGSIASDVVRTTTDNHIYTLPSARDRSSLPNLKLSRKRARGVSSASSELPGSDLAQSRGDCMDSNYSQLHQVRPTLFVYLFIYLFVCLFICLLVLLFLLF